MLVVCALREATRVQRRRRAGRGLKNLDAPTLQPRIHKRGRFQVGELRLIRVVYLRAHEARDGSILSERGGYAGLHMQTEGWRGPAGVGLRQKSHDLRDRPFRGSLLGTRHFDLLA